MLTPFVLDATDPFAPRLELNGEDVSRQVLRCSLDVVPGESPKLYVTYVGGGKIEGAAQVVAVAEQHEAVLAFLNAIDPATLDKLVLDRAGWGTSPMLSALEVLRELASAD